MKKKSAVGLAFAMSLLTACAPTTQHGHWREGVSYQKVKSDRTDCAVSALNTVPRETAVRTVPGYVTPIQVSPISTQCYGNGNFGACTTSGGVVTGGQVIGGGVYTYDQNAALREQVTDQCLAKKGYQKVVFPTCTSEQAKKAVISSQLPAIDKVECVVSDTSAEQRSNIKFVLKPIYVN
jgi:hypothetical protein